MNVTAIDGSTSSPAAERSGVGTLDFALLDANGVVVRNSPDPSTQNCESGNCARIRSWTLNTDGLADGVYTAS